MFNLNIFMINYLSFNFIIILIMPELILTVLETKSINPEVNIVKDMSPCANSKQLLL